MTDPHRSLEELETLPGLVWVDVRSPREYDRGHVPGALNLPVLDDAGRARVGTVYAQDGPMAAKLLGLELVGPRLAPLVKRFAELANDAPVALYCWRGGMRSGLIGHLLRGLGIPVLIARGGYRAHRRAVMSWLASRIPPLVVLHGYTGSGKTLLLRRLARRYPVIDLEGLGRHRGSTFGAVGLEPQPTQLQFESELVRAFQRCEAQRAAGPGAGPLLIEGESPALGALKLPAELIHAMRTGWRLVLKLPRSLRTRVLVDEYGPVIRADPGCLDKPFAYLAGRLSGRVLETLTAALASGNLEAFCELLLERHYDPLYERWSRRGEQRDYREIEVASLEEAEAGVAAGFEEIAGRVRAGEVGPSGATRDAGGGLAPRAVEHAVPSTRTATPGRT